MPATRRKDASPTASLRGKVSLGHQDSHLRFLCLNHSPSNVPSPLPVVLHWLGLGSYSSEFPLALWLHLTHRVLVWRQHEYPPQGRTCQSSPRVVPFFCLHPMISHPLPPSRATNIQAKPHFLGGAGRGGCTRRRRLRTTADTLTQWKGEGTGTEPESKHKGKQGGNKALPLATPRPLPLSPFHRETRMDGIK